MIDTILLIFVPIIAVGGLAGAAYWLQKRSGKVPAAVQVFPPAGPVGKALVWVTRILVSLMVITVGIAFGFRLYWMIWITAGCLVAGAANGWVYRIVRLVGK